MRADVDFDGPVRHLEAHFARSRAGDPLNALLYVYVKTYLVDELLRAIDAMSMWNSSRSARRFSTTGSSSSRCDTGPSPDALARGRASCCARWRRGRSASRSTAERGFAPPVGEWIREELGERVRDALSTSVVRARGVFDPWAAAQRVLAGALAGDAAMVQRRR